MIYEGKDYVEVAHQYAKKGDLAHITEVNGTKCDDYRFICHVDGGDFIFDERLSVGWCFVIRSDTFKTYRYVKDVEETPVPKEQIIPLTNPNKTHDLINQTSKNIKKNDTVNSPSHYNQTKIEAIDIIEDVTAGYQSNVKYRIGNAIKYLIRAPFKNNTVEDLKKAVWYIQRAIEKLEGEE